jgi:hypothetical protein
MMVLAHKLYYILSMLIIDCVYYVFTSLLVLVHRFDFTFI